MKTKNRSNIIWMEGQATLEDPSFEEQIELEEMEEDTEKELPLEAHNVKYLGSEFCNDRTLFEGYDTLKAVTFSYNLGYIAEVLHYFKRAEIIIGCEWRAKYDIQEIAAFQQTSLEMIRRNRYLLERIEKGELTIYLAKEYLIHSKIYILGGADKSRIITGSANFGRKAFSGNVQKEHIEKYDNDKVAMVAFEDEFESMKLFCTNEVLKDAVCIGDKEDPLNPRKLPIFREAVAKEGGIILNETRVPDEVEYATTLEFLKRRFDEISPVFVKQGSVTYITAEKVHELNRKYDRSKEENEQKAKLYPKLHLDLQSGTIAMNDQKIALKTEPQKVKRDIECVLKFFEGYKEQIGDVQKDQRTYFMLMNYMFLSVFIPTLRHEAYVTGENYAYFPVYAIINGKKSAGKSTFMETMHRLMYGQEICTYSSESFTAGKVRDMMSNLEGVAVHFDDLDSKRFNAHGQEMIKNERYLLESNCNHPTVLITTNSIMSIKKEIAKRAYYAKLTLTQEDVVAAKNKRKLTALKKKMGTSLFRAYLEQMIPAVGELVQKMYTVKPEEEWHPDIFELSSKVLIRLIQDNGLEVPEYFAPLSYEDYFGQNNDIRDDIKKSIRFQWEHNRKAFKVSRKKNELRYTAGELQYEAERILDALPETMGATRAGCDVIMPLDDAERFFKIKFRTGLW